MNERHLIERIRKLFPRAGDDAAVIGQQLFTTDMLVEGIDFTANTPLRSIARKSIAVNLSDIAAMGGRPHSVLAAIGSPTRWDLGGLIDELARAAADFHVEVLGGDLSAAEALTIAITAIGEAERPILRSGARAGERIYISRPLGGSAAGFHLLQSGWSPAGTPPVGATPSYSQREFAAAAIRHHLEPEPEVDLGLQLAETASACIDISDGLSSDLHNLCEASGAGAEIVRERIPLLAGLLTDGVSLGIDVAAAVLHGGEEYALLFTSTLRESELSRRFGRPVYAIGRVTGEREVRIDGSPLEPRGWDHFAR